MVANLLGNLIIMGENGIVKCFEKHLFGLDQPITEKLDPYVVVSFRKSRD